MNTITNNQKTIGAFCDRMAEIRFGYEKLAADADTYSELLSSSFMYEPKNALDEAENAFDWIGDLLAGDGNPDDADWSEAYGALDNAERVFEEYSAGIIDAIDDAWNPTVGGPDLVDATDCIWAVASATEAQVRIGTDSGTFPAGYVDAVDELTTVIAQLLQACQLEEANGITNILRAGVDAIFENERQKDLGVTAIFGDKYQKRTN